MRFAGSSTTFTPGALRSDIEIALADVRLIEALVRRVVLLLIPQMPFAEERRRVARRLQGLGDRHNFGRQILRAIAARYQRVFVWADDPKRAGSLRGILPGSVALHSPYLDDVKWDANQMLQAKVLDSFLTQLLGVTCHGRYV